jgi:hypothetical protein
MADTRKFQAFKHAARTDLAVSRQNRLLELLREADPSLSMTSFCRMNDGTASTRIIERFDVAIDELVARARIRLPEEGLANWIVLPTRVALKATRFECPDARYNGVWIAVHYPTVREPKERRPGNKKYRTALLVYGGDTSKGREYTMYGYSAVFTGHVVVNKGRLYYQGDETEEGFERAYMILKEADLRHDQTHEHGGIMLGVGRGGQDPEGPIYATKILLRRIPMLTNSDILEATLESRERRRDWCTYVREEPNRKDLRGREKAIQDAIRSFRAMVKSPGNQFSLGDRLFLK